MNKRKDVVKKVDGKSKKKGTSFKLDKEDRDKLEAIQKDMAVDSMGTAIRKLIRDYTIKKKKPNDD